jgi:penicillin-binding protein 1A
MADEGFITRAEAEAAKKKPIVTVGRPPIEFDSAFFVEEVRQQLEDRYGAQQLYENGLSVYTTLDLKLQHAAETALADGMRRIDHRRGFRKPVRVEPDEVAAYKHPAWTAEPPAVGTSAVAIVTGVEGAKVHVRVGTLEGELGREQYAWTGRTSGSFLATGDVVRLLVTSVDAATHRIAGTLDQDPEFEGAVLAIQNRTGRVLAMIGGKRFELSRFNRATQAMRQLGSTFKPIVYAAAIDRGFTPVSILQDSPVAYPAGPGQPLYSPLNYDKKFEGPITLRHGLEQSRNVPTVRLMEQLGPTSVADYARRLGFKSQVQPYLSSALGSSEATLQEVVSAFAAFPNQGVRVEPFEILRVTDRQGNMLEENRPKSKEALRADTAFVMTHLLRGVVERGTAAKAASLKWPLGGKTGTTDDFTDAWFIGFDPDITIGVWIGYDRKKPLGQGESGAQAALPIWMDIMKTWIADRKTPPEFAVPANVVFLPIDRYTGAPTDPGTPGAINEVFIAGTQPGAGFGSP